jgi:tetratricopeptide (TPR) repeat protein
LANGAEIMCAKGRWQEALTMAEPAIMVLSREWGLDHPALAYPLTSLGIALIGLGRPVQALPHLERALELREAKDPEPRLLGETRFALARALWSVGRSEERAYRLAKRAELDLGGSKESLTEQRASEVGRWLSARGGSFRRSMVAAVTRP